MSLNVRDHKESSILLLSAILGFLWGTLVTPLWHEMVESGLALSGQIDSYIPFYVSDYSLQITVPAVLFKFGFSPEFVALLTSGVCVSLAFAAVTALTFLLSDSVLCALLAPVFLCKYPFYNFHYYPVKFPIYNYIFGQFGFYAAVLTIALLALGRRSSAFLMAGLMAGIHLPWALGVYLFGSVYLILNKTWGNLQKRHWYFFATGLLFSILAGAYHMSSLAPAFMEKQVSYERESMVSPERFAGLADVLTELEAVSQEGNIVTGNDQSAGGADDIFMDRRLSFESRRTSHNLLFIDNPMPWLEALKFFFIDILLFASLFYVIRRPQPGMAGTVRLAAFTKALLCFQLLVVAYKLLDEIDPQWRMFGILHESLPGLLLRVIPNRWMNIDLILFPIVFLAILFGYIKERRNLPALTGVLVLLIIPWLPETDGHNYGLSALLGLLKFQLAGFFIAFLITTLLVLVPALQHWRWPAGDVFTLKVLSYVVGCVCLISVLFHAVGLHSSGDYLRRKDGDIVTATAGREGIILPAFGVQGFGNFNILAQLGRPYFLPDSVLLPVPGSSGTQLDVFCDNGAGNTVSARRAWQAECWEKRDQLTWQYIAQQLKVSQVLTRSDVNLELPMAGASSDFYVYDIN